MIFGSFSLFPIFICFLNEFLKPFLLKKSQKGGCLLVGADVASGTRWRADVARGTSAWMRRGIEAMWQSHGRPARGAGRADAWQEATRTPRRGATWHRRVRIWRAHEYSGPW